MIWATVSSRSCFHWLYSFSFFSCKEYNQSNLVFYHLVMSMCRVVSCVVGRECFLWSMCSIGKTLSAFTLLQSVLQGQTCLLLQVSLDFLLLHFFPYDENAPFLVLVLEGLVSLLRMSQFQLLSQWLWHRLGSQWYWLVCLGNKLRSFCHFGDCIQILHFRASQVALMVKNPPAIAGAAVDCGSISGSGRYPEEGNGYPHQYSCMKNSMGQGAWQATVHGVSKSQTRLSTHTHWISDSSDWLWGLLHFF